MNNYYQPKNDKNINNPPIGGSNVFVPNGKKISSADNNQHQKIQELEKKINELCAIVEEIKKEWTKENDLLSS